MDIKKLSEPLSIDQIEFRVQSINKGGYATILAYKNARVDQQRLDDIVGPLNWKRSHSNNNRNCTVSIWCDEKKEWISKEDTGTESNTEKEKGLASDSFKRACFNWGIGRELYNYPFIQVKLKDDEWKIDGGRAKAEWKLMVGDWIWFSQFEGGAISFLAAKEIINGNAELRFSWGKYKNEESK